MIHTDGIYWTKILHIFTHLCTADGRAVNGAQMSSRRAHISAKSLCVENSAACSAMHPFHGDMRHPRCVTTHSKCIETEESDDRGTTAMTTSTNTEKKLRVASRARDGNRN